jgi:hypothetical protein
MQFSECPTNLVTTNSIKGFMGCMESLVMACKLDFIVEHEQYG